MSIPFHVLSTVRTYLVSVFFQNESPVSRMDDRTEKFNIVKLPNLDNNEEVTSDTFFFSIILMKTSRQKKEDINSP